MFIPPRNSSIDNPGQDDSPAQPSTAGINLPSDPFDLRDQIPPTPDHLIATVAQNPQDSPRSQSLRAYLPANSRPFCSLWPTEPNSNVGLLNDSQRCPHKDVSPCCCRNNTDRRGFACQRCRFAHCSMTYLLQRGSAKKLEHILQAEQARCRGAQQFEQELQSALNAARLREAGPADDAELQRYRRG